MSRSRFRRSFVRAVALAYLLVTSGPGLALVFCAGNDGHLAIESALMDECCAEAQSNTPELSGLDDCSGCTDTPVALKGAFQKKSSRGDVPPALHVATLPPLFGGTHIASVETLRRASAALRTADAAARRSVVLLI